MTGYHGKDMEQPQTFDDIGPITSDQADIHTGLRDLVRKHVLTRWRKPTPTHTAAAVDAGLQWLAARNRPIIIDSFCGTGMSTAVLAERFPEHSIIGLDQSLARLQKHQAQEADNYLLLRAECEPFWRALVDAGITIEQHYLLFPNPWPKARHLKRRIHGHPGFPLLAELGGTLELRSNWEIYVREFAIAATFIDRPGRVYSYQPTAPMTLFERKYHERAQGLWCFQSTPPEHRGSG